MRHLVPGTASAAALLMTAAAAPATPPAVTARAVAMAAACQSAGGTLGNGDRPLIYNSFDFTGDGRPDWVFDEAGFGCGGRPNQFVDAGGARLEVFTEANGAWVAAFDARVFSFKVTAGNPAVLEVTQKGALCGAGSDPTTSCVRSLSYQAASHSLGVAGLVAAAAPGDQNDAIFRAAGFKPRGKDYVRCEEDDAPSYTPGAIERKDLNGDGKAEAIVTEGSGGCYGAWGEYFVVLRQEAAGAWTKILEAEGIMDIRSSKHNGWPDILAGGPGMGKMPVSFYNGSKYIDGGSIQP